MFRLKVPTREAFSNRPSPALVISLLALFVALGGTGYAALRVNGSNIVNRTIPARKVKKGVLTTKEIKNHSLLTKDFGPGQIPSGSMSLRMREGPTVLIPAGSFNSAQVNCLPGERATGGGVYNEANVLSLKVTSSYPLPNPTSPPATGDGLPPTGWRVWMANETATDQPVNAYVICAAP